MPDRLACLVPFCRRTWKGDGWADEWICERHWTPLPPLRRRAYRRMRRRWRQNDDLASARRAAVMWRVLLRQAIERTAGL